MYWPIGAPRAYSLSKHASTAYSEDGTDESGGLAGSARNGEQLKPVAGHPQSNGTGAHDTEKGILAATLSRSGAQFCTITRTSITVWQSKPVVALASVLRSPQSLKAYGANVALTLRPDAQVVVVQTELGFLITYTISIDPQALVYRIQLPDSHRHAAAARDAYRRPSTAEVGPGESDGIREVTLRFRMVIRIDAGISAALALDEELMVATKSPAALQCIRWVAEEGTPQSRTQLLRSEGMEWWKSEQHAVSELVHDRPMNLSVWTAEDGNAYAVQRQRHSSTAPKDLFRGFCFHQGGEAAVKVAVNARFSLIAVGTASGNVEIYTVKNYSGNIPLSHKHMLQTSFATSGRLTSLAYSPDGYALFVGYERGWALWSVYGKALASSWSCDRAMAKTNREAWLTHGVRDAFWLGGGCELAILSYRNDRIWILEVARSAATTCLTAPNVGRGLLIGSNTVTFYRGHDVPDLIGIGGDMSLWQTVQIPGTYLADQWPMKCAVISADSKYIAVAGKKGLAHYSVASGRWKMFDNPAAEQTIAVRGGMAWYQHFLVAAVESGGRYLLRVYSREKALEKTVFDEELSAPVILLTTSGSDSLLVYTHDNVLLHYIITPTASGLTSSGGVKLVQVGRIGFHGIIRAPPRVRAISWILPEEQIEHGDPARDVETASVLFLVDAKLVLLQPVTDGEGGLKYDMRVLRQGVEYYMLLQDQDLGEVGAEAHGLQDSLWYFDGTDYHVWTDVHDVLAAAPADLERDLPTPIRVPLDFYPVSASIAAGLAHGLDSELVQRRDINFSFFRHPARTQLFLPHLLRHHLAEYNDSAALGLAEKYKDLPYFAHALEILLHDVLDAEVDTPPTPPETALLPSLVSFLSSFPAYLDVVVNCTRKTELRSWRTLFACLPPVLELFEQSLQAGKLKTAAGYLLVLHAFEQEGAFQSKEFARLLGVAVGEGDWDLCGELARFLVGIDSSGETLRGVLAEAGLRDGVLNGQGNGSDHTFLSEQADPLRRQATSIMNGTGAIDGVADYFSMGSHG
ncbi:WD40 repeat protein [Elasticomyces elasticus]|nr:WD40 repeat protein [Elasticomyces elasticus]KAK4977631.1 WD40 repeat protein [Elasticomyces elasticus]